MDNHSLLKFKLWARVVLNHIKPASSMTDCTSFSFLLWPSRVSTYCFTESAQQTRATKKKKIGWRTWCDQFQVSHWRPVPTDNQYLHAVPACTKLECQRWRNLLHERPKIWSPLIFGTCLHVACWSSSMVLFFARGLGFNSWTSPLLMHLICPGQWHPLSSKVLAQWKLIQVNSLVAFL